MGCGLCCCLNQFFHSQAGRHSFIKGEKFPQTDNWNSVLILSRNYNSFPKESSSSPAVPVSGNGILLKNVYVLGTQFSEIRCRNFWTGVSVIMFFLICGLFHLTYRSCLFLVFLSLDQGRHITGWITAISWVPYHQLGVSVQITNGQDC